MKADAPPSRKKQNSQEGQVLQEKKFEPELTPLYISKNHNREKTVNLLLISNSRTSHYVYIKDINALLRKPGTTSPVSVCLNCFSRFYGKDRDETLKRHQQQCYLNEPAKICFPRDRVIKFSNVRTQQR